MQRLIRSRKAVAFAVVALFSSAVFVAYYFSDVARASRDLDNQRIAARAEGVPIDFALLRRSPISEKENAAPAFGEATRLIHGISPGLLVGYQARAKVSLAEYTQYEQAFAAAEAAGKLSLLDPDYDYEKGFDLKWPELSQVRSVVGALCRRAEARADSGQSQLAIHDLHVASRFLGLLKDGPSLYEANIRVRNEDSILKSLFWIATFDQGSVKSSDVVKLIAGFGSLPNPRAIFAYDAAVSVNFAGYIAQSVADPASEIFGDEVDLLLRLPVIVQANECHAIEYWREVYRILPSDPKLARQGAAEWRKISAKYDPRRGLGYLLSTITAPAYSQSLLSIAKMDATRTLALRAIQLIERGKPFPKSITDIDPLSGKPFGYQRLADGFRIWSVGMNQKDDGGKDRTGAVGSRADDIVFAYPVPKLAQTGRLEHGEPKLKLTPRDAER